ncbi:MAG: M28 family metallopeptidase [Promethearchaeota archaeon]
MIDEKRIRKNLETFSFPRLSGTKEEKKIFKIVKKKIEDLNLTPSVQEFSFSTFYSRIYPKIAVILTFWFLFVLYLNIEGIFWVINIILISIIFIPLFIITRKPEKIRIGKNLNSQNLYVKISSNSQKNDLKTKYSNTFSNSCDNNIFLFSHLDSKGQSLPIHIRGKVFKIWIYSLLASLIIILLKNFIFHQFSIWFYFIGAVPLGINFISTILIMSNITTNKSPGALDDASGITCVLELLNFYISDGSQENSLQNLNLWFVFTGAEECGTMGIRNFYNKIKHFNRKTSLFLNFDSIGKNLIIFSSANEEFNYFNLYKHFFEEARKFNAIVYSKKPLIYTTHSDGYFLYNKGGFLGMGFADFLVYKYIHTVNDTLDKVDPIVLKKLCELITTFLKGIDDSIL